ncbi:zinc-ribbon domain-containing protein [bacterium]|nr:zinc-ribbon domain-containing protein [bacterium]
MKYCSHCGEELEDEAVVCVKCGCSAGPAKNRVLEDPNESTLLYGVLGFFVPLAGLILFLLWNDTYPRRAKSAGKGALISVIIGVVTSIIGSIVYFAFLSALIGGTIH